MRLGGDRVGLVHKKAVGHPVVHVLESRFVQRFSLVVTNPQRCAVGSIWAPLGPARAGRRATSDAVVLDERGDLGFECGHNIPPS